MTDPKMALLELIEQEADTDLVREMLAYAAGRMMDLEIDARTGSGGGNPLAGSTEPPQRLLGKALGHVCQAN